MGREAEEKAAGEDGDKREGEDDAAASLRGIASSEPHGLSPRTPFPWPGGCLDYCPALPSVSPRDGAARGNEHITVLWEILLLPSTGSGDSRSSATGKAGESSPINASIKAH